MADGLSLRTEHGGPADSVDVVIAPYQRRAQLAQGLLRLFIVVNMVADLFPPDAYFTASLIAIALYAGWSTVLLLVNTARWVGVVVQDRDALGTLAPARRVPEPVGP
ncbi:hypothetical protein ABTY94_36885, partial [Streptomyces sp. NPDC096030]